MAIGDSGIVTICSKAELGHGLDWTGKTAPPGRGGAARCICGQRKSTLWIWSLSKFDLGGIFDVRYGMQC